MPPSTGLVVVALPPRPPRQPRRPRLRFLPTYKTTRRPPRINPPDRGTEPKPNQVLTDPILHLLRQRSSPATAAAEARTAGAAGTTTTSRFAAACGALSQYVRAAEAERMLRAWPAAPVRPLRLMPGADVYDDGHTEEAGRAPQLTIVYGGRALVLDDVPADRAADLLRLAAAARGCTGQLSSAADLPVARKASLQRFMEKRKGRAAAARAEPYRRPGE